MAEQKVAAIYGDIKYRFDQKTLKQLKEFKSTLKETKKQIMALGKSDATKNKSAEARERKRIALQRQRLKLLRAEVMFSSKIANAPARERGALTRSFQAAKTGLEGGKLTNVQFDQRMVALKQKLADATQRQAGAQRQAARAARQYARDQRMAAKALFSFNTRLHKGAIALSRQKMETRGLRYEMKKLRSGVIALTGAYTAFSAFANINRVGQDFERVGFLMEAVLGKQAPDAMRFITGEAKRLGVDLISSAKGFSKYVASAKPLGFTLEEMQSQFRGLAEASVVFGLSADQQFGVIRALEQMAS